VRISRLDRVDVGNKNLQIKMRNIIIIIIIREIKWQFLDRD